MLKPLPDPIGVRLIQPGRQNLEAFARHRKLDAGSNVNVMLPAGSNSQYSATLAAHLLGALHADCRDAAMRIIARLDLRQTPQGKRLPKQTPVAEMDAMIAQMNADPSAHADETMSEMGWLRQLEEYCQQRGREMVLLIQQQTNSRVEAERAVCPPEGERDIVGIPSHVIQVAHVGSLARRQRLGAEDGMLKPGALDIPRRNIVMVASSTMPKEADPKIENPAETVSYVAALLEDFGVPLAAIRRALSSFKGAWSPVKKD